MENYHPIIRRICHLICAVSAVITFHDRNEKEPPAIVVHVVVFSQASLPITVHVNKTAAAVHHGCTAELQ